MKIKFVQAQEVFDKLMDLNISKQKCQTGSMYFYLPNGKTVRFSDHSSPVWRMPDYNISTDGIVNVFERGGRGERLRQELLAYLNTL